MLHRQVYRVSPPQGAAPGVIACHSPSYYVREYHSLVLCEASGMLRICDVQCLSVAIRPTPARWWPRRPFPGLQRQAAESPDRQIKWGGTAMFKGIDFFDVE